MKSMWWNRKSVYSKLERMLIEYKFSTIQRIVLNYKNKREDLYEKFNK